MELCRIPKSFGLAPTRWKLLASLSSRLISSQMTNISAESVTFLRHKILLTFDLCSASSIKCRYCNSLRKYMAPFREYLNPSATFYWDDQLQQIVLQTKAAVHDKIIRRVRIVNSKRVTCLATSWFKKGIGFGLLHAP